MPVETDALFPPVTAAAPPPERAAAAPPPERAAAAPPPELVAVDPRGRRRRLPRWVRRSLAPILLLALWQALGATGVLPEQTLSPPVAVLRRAVEMTADGTLPSAMAVSLQRVLYGLALGGLIGTGLALASGLSRLGEDLVDPVVQMLRTVPFIGLIPLLIIWVGIGEAPKVVLIALGVGFNLYLNLHAGIRSVDDALVEAGGSLGLNRRQQIRHVILPGALPGLMTGLRYALTVSWLALVFGETINADNGIGFLMNQAREFFQTDVIVVCLLVYALLGLTADLIVRTLERTLLSWRPTFSGT
ncbi:ABC transporter permease [Kitasatospora aureofaciens]|uniref:ABC transporter permease n=1 Tax=Kitasatospora aureofaciens TaxID=1894 RepID=UPI0037CC616C